MYMYIKKESSCMFNSSTNGFVIFLKLKFFDI